MRERLYSPDSGLVPNFNGLNLVPSVPKLIGLTGYARSGKDTVGEIIHRLYGHTVLSFSDILREFIYAQDLLIADEKGFAIRLNEVVDGIGWEEARNRFPYIRTLQQKTGQEAGRDVLGQDVWLEAWALQVEDNDLLVNPSVRYLNEARLITALGGVVLRVRRPGVLAVNEHVSDRALDDYQADATIFNDGSLADLEGEVQRVLGAFE